MFVNKKHEAADQLLREGKIDDALKLYLEILNENQTSPDLMSDIGVAYLHKDDEKLSLSYLNIAIELQPDYSYRYACRAFALNHFKQIDLAIEDYKKAIELDPDDAIAHNNLGMLLEQKGYQGEAQKRFEQADRLMKAEDQLLKMMEELEADDQPKEIRNEVEPDQSKSNDENASGWKEMKRIFTSSQQRREFINFLKNGFKLK